MSRNSSCLIRAGQEDALRCLMPHRLKSVGTNVPAQCKGHTEGREMEVMYKHCMSQVMIPSHSPFPFTPDKHVVRTYLNQPLRKVKQPYQGCLYI